MRYADSEGELRTYSCFGLVRLSMVLHGGDSCSRRQSVVDLGCLVREVPLANDHRSAGGCRCSICRCQAAQPPTGPIYNFYDGNMKADKWASLTGILQGSLWTGKEQLTSQFSGWPWSFSITLFLHSALTIS